MSYNRSRKRKYVKNACTNCRAAHASCTNKKACRRCVKLNLVCTVETSSKKRRKTEATTPKVPLPILDETIPSSPALSEAPLRETSLCFTGVPAQSPVPLVPDNGAREQLKQSREALEKMDLDYVNLLAEIEEKKKEISTLSGEYSPAHSMPSSPATISSPISSPYSSHMQSSDSWNSAAPTSLLPVPAAADYDLLAGASSPYFPQSPCDASSTSATDDEADDADLMSSSWSDPLDSSFKKDLTSEPAFSSSFLPETGFDIWQQAVCF